MDNIKKCYYEAVFAETECGDLEISTHNTLAEAKKALLKMINKKSFADAYIRKFQYNACFNDYEAIKDYNIR